MKRTYSRKGMRRRERNSAESSEEQPAESSSDVRPHKRHRIQVEVVLPSTQSPSQKHRSDTSYKRIDELGDAKHHADSAVSRDLTPTPTTVRTPSPEPITPSRVKMTSLSRTPTKSLDSLPSNAPQPRSLRKAATLPSISSDGGSAPPTPKKPAKDLSSLFDFSLPTTVKPSSKAGNSNIRRRMLGRSRTDLNETHDRNSSGSSRPLDIRAPPSESGPRRPEQLPKRVASPPLRSIPDSPSKIHTLDEVSVLEPTPRPSLVGASNIRTYAGTSRSFLVPLPNSHLSSLPDASQSTLDDHSNTGDTQEDGFEIQESYTDLRLRWGVDNSEDDPPSHISETPSPVDKSKRKGKGKQIEPTVFLPNGMMNDLKSITELRSKGETRRFLDEVGYLFEGLDGEGAIGVRRASALEIVTKLCDADFARRARIADFLGRAWEALRGAGAGNGDKVLDTTLALFAALAAQDPSDLVDLAGKSDFVPVLYNLLDMTERENDPLWLVSFGLSDVALKQLTISKIEKTLLVSLQSLISKQLGLCDEGEMPSTRWLLSKALSALPAPLQNTSYLPSLLRNVSRELLPLSSRISAYTSGLDLFPRPAPTSYKDILSISHLDCCLSLLDSFLLGRWPHDDEERIYRDVKELDLLRKEGFGQALVVLCVTCDLLGRTDESVQRRRIAHRCMESTLRVLINLTHDDSQWSETVLHEPMAIPMAARIVITSQRKRATSLKPEGGEHEDNAATSCLDCLCLVLGLLTNLVQASEEAADIVRETSLAYDCPNDRRCLKSCRCSSSTSILQCFAQVYTEHCNSSDELDSVVRGHMAMLFGLLMRGSPDNQQMLIAALPGSSYRSKLDGLIENAREFTLFYLALTKKVSAPVGNADAETETSGPVKREGRGVMHDVKGDTIAGDVVSFLERLRDRRLSEHL